MLTLALALLVGNPVQAKPKPAAAAKPVPAPVGVVGAIDAALQAAWKKEKVTPAVPVDDARYLRRVSLDLVGTVPSIQEMQEFLADKSPDKRAKAVERLLAGDKYSLHWTNYWDNVLMGRQVRAQLVDRVSFRNWLYTQFSKNVAWDKFVYSLITASGVNSKGGDRRAQFMAAGAKPQMMDAEETVEVGLGGPRAVNGAVNWFLKYAQTPADLSGNASRIFLGVQIQCAQCHDHKTEKWTQKNFKDFTACFVGARPVPVNRDASQQMIRQVDLRDIQLGPVARRAQQRMQRAGGEYADSTPTVLNGQSLEDESNKREALAKWMTAPENPWFAEAIVNRVWAHFMGRGFVEPIDDFRTSNPAVMPELLKKIADDFVAHDYDLKHLMKSICATKAYQLSSGPAKMEDGDNKLWARYRLKPMQPEVLLDSVMTATGVEPLIQRIAGQNLDQLKAQLVRQFTFLFEVDEENEQKEFEGTIPQALMFLNGGLVHSGAGNIPGTALAETLAMTGADDKKIEALYLRTLGRMPTNAEVRKWTGFVNEERDVVLNGLPQQQSTQQAVPQPPPGLTPRQRLQFMREQQTKMQELRRQQMRQMMQQAGNRRNPGGDPLAGAAGRLTYGEITPKSQAYEDLFWALLNSSEFLFNH